MPDNPLVIVFLAAVVLIAIWMAIEGFVLAYNGVVWLASKWGKHLPATDTGDATSVLAPPPDMPAHTTGDATSVPPPAGNILAAMAVAKPHLLVVGHTGGGKSILTRAFVKHLLASGAKVVALDPDAAPRHYPAHVQLINDDEQWGAAIAAVAAIFNERNEAYREGTERFSTFWLVADECQELLAVDGVLQTIERIIRRGRKLNMRVLLAVQDSQVKTLGLERKSALLANLSRVEVSKRGDDRVANVDGVEHPVPDLPTTYDGACGAVINLVDAAPQPAASKWTDKHVLAAGILAAEPDVSGRELSRRLYGGDGSGEAYYRAKKIREDIETMKEEQDED
jgi:hypothetical protein